MPESKIPAPRTLRVAAVQVTSENGAPDANLAHAESFVRQAAKAGAELVLCPEFLASGYVFDEVLWQAAEPAEGRTERWLSRIARELRISVGASYLEADGEDFFNTFALYHLDGSLLGRVRKGSLPFFEGWYFKASEEPKVISTPFGKLAIGICNDNQTSQFFCQLLTEKPDLILMPHSAPTPRFPLIKSVIGRMLDQQLHSVARRYSSSFGVPVVLANKYAPEPTKSPIPLIPGLKVPLAFEGHSSIWDADGRMLGELVGREGVVVAEVKLDPALRRSPDAPRAGYWAFEPDFLPKASGALMRVLDRLGRRSYRNNPRRAEHASQTQGFSATTTLATKQASDTLGVKPTSAAASAKSSLR